MIVQCLEENQFETSFVKELQSPISSASSNNSLALCLGESYAIDVTIMCLNGESLIPRSINQSGGITLARDYHLVYPAPVLPQNSNFVSRDQTAIRIVWNNRLHFIGIATFRAAYLI